MNRCTGDATQMTLWELISSTCAVDYISHQIGLGHESTIEYRRVTSNNNWRNSLTPSGHSALIVCMRKLLRMLQDTGKYEDGRFILSTKNRRTMASMAWYSIQSGHRTWRTLQTRRVSRCYREAATLDSRGQSVGVQRHLRWY
jgi:hypothetical protein